jgi:hypothetical protein
VSTHHCPCCDLIYDQKTVLEYHLRNDHPDVHFDYPVVEPVDADWPLASEPRKYSWRPTYPIRHVP